MATKKFLELQQHLRSKARLRIVGASKRNAKLSLVKPHFILANYIKPSLVKTLMPSCNASLFRWKGKPMVLARETNYTFRRNDKVKAVAGWPVIHGWPSNQHCYTNEILYELDPESNEAKQVGYLSYVPEADRHRLNYIGYEDVRLMEWDGKLVASFTVVDNDHNFTMAYATVNDDLTLGSVTKVPTENAIEKNWQPIEGKPHQYIYSLRPYCLIDVATGRRQVVGEGTAQKLRGSSPVIAHRGQRLCMAHINNWPACKTYVHVFVLFDEAMNIVKVTKPFAFFGAPIEFNTSIFSSGDNLEVLFSVHDQLLYRVTLTPDLLDRILEGQLADSTPVPKLYERLYFDALENKNFKTAVGLATFSKDQSIRSEAQKLARELPDVSQDNKDQIVRQLALGCKFSSWP